MKQAPMTTADTSLAPMLLRSARVIAALTVRVRGLSLALQAHVDANVAARAEIARLKDELRRR